jgi:hypothetical protein
MKKPTNENLIPEWIADLFRSKNRSKQEQLKLDRYVADLRMRDPRKHEKLQSILKHIDPDTGHLPTGLNTAGSMDENIASDLISAGFKTWEYTDENGRSFYPKGRNEKEAALWLRLRHKMKVDPSQIKLADRSGLGYADDTTIDIYNQKYQPDDVMENRLRKIVKELMADMPPMEKVTTLPGEDIKDQMVSALASTNDPKVLMQLAIQFGGAGFKSSDNIGMMKKKLIPLMKNAGASEYLKLSRSFGVENGEIVSKGKEDVMYSNVKENKMKVTQLKQIIKEEIQKVMNEGRSAELFIQGADPMSDSFRADSGPGSELADELYYDKRYSTQIPKKDLIIALKNFGLDDVVNIVNTVPGDALSFSRDQLYYGGPGKIMISPMRKPNVSDPEIEKFKDAEFRRKYQNRSLDPRSTD